jgi:hypothetical protein
MILIAIATLRTPTILSRLCASSTAVKSITPMVFTTLTRTPADAIFTINGSALNVLSTAASQIRMAPTRLAMGAAALTALRGTMLPSVVSHLWIVRLSTLVRVNLKHRAHVNATPFINGTPLLQPATLIVPRFKMLIPPQVLPFLLQDNVPVSKSSILIHTFLNV